MKLLHYFALKSKWGPNLADFLRTLSVSVTLLFVMKIFPFYIAFVSQRGQALSLQALFKMREFL